MKILLASRLSDLQSKYQDFTDQISYMAQHDPSGNQKYLDYATKVLVLGEAAPQEIVSVINLFHKNQSRLPVKDINRYNFSELSNIVKQLANSLTTTEEKKEIKQTGAKKIYEDDQVLVLQIKDKAAACFYGAGTKWCITMSGSSHLEMYGTIQSIIFALLRKDLSQLNPLYKIGMEVKTRDGKVVKIEYFDAEDKIIPEDKIAPDVNAWSTIKQIILDEASSAKHASRDAIINALSKSQEISFNIQEELIDRYYSDPQIMSILIDKNLSHLNQTYNLNYDTEGEIIQDEESVKYLNEQRATDILTEILQRSSNPTIIQKLKDIGFEKESGLHMANIKKEGKQDKEEKIPLSQVKKMPYKSLNRMIKKMREYLKQNEVVQKMFKEYEVDISEIDLIPMMFGNLDVSAKTDHGVIIFNYKLLTDGDFFKDFSYGVHEMTHWLQQTTGTKATKSSDDGSYLDNPYEQEGFQNQVQYIADQFGDDEAEQYVDDLLEHHEVEDKKEVKEKKETLMAKV